MIILGFHQLKMDIFDTITRKSQKFELTFNFKKGF